MAYCIRCVCLVWVIFGGLEMGKLIEERFDIEKWHNKTLEEISEIVSGMMERNGRGAHFNLPDDWRKGKWSFAIRHYEEWTKLEWSEQEKGMEKDEAAVRAYQEGKGIRRGRS